MAKRARTSGLLDALDTRLVDQMPAALCACEAPSGRILRYNQRAVRLWGREPTPEQRFSGALRILHLDGRVMPADETPIAEVVRGGSPVHDRHIIIERPDGSHVTVALFVSPLQDSHGRLTGAASAFEDVTDHLRADATQAMLYEALQESVRLLHEKDTQLNLMLESAVIGLWEYDLQTMRATRSLTHDRIFGYPAPRPAWNLETFLGHVVFEQRDAVQSRFQNCVTTGEGEFECRIIRADGVPAWIWSRSRVVRDPISGSTRMLGVVMDITGRKKADQLLISAERRRKDDFVATLAHELRQPLSPILAALDVMQLDDSPATGERARRVIKRQVVQINRLVEDLVDAARMARGKVTLQKARIDLQEIVADAVTDVSTLLEERGHKLIRSSAGAATWIEGDAGRLQQVFSNLLRNAVKYTEPGGRIWLTVERARKTVTVRVRDTGHGIEPDALDYIFDLFTQARSPETGGLGIGLSVVHQLVKAHDGTIEARSEGAGKGSEFIVTLPLLTTSAESNR